jgi:hypothetical protein
MTVEYKNARNMMDSLSARNEFSHPKATIAIVKEIMFFPDQKTYCNKYLGQDPLKLELSERNKSL